MPFKFPPAKDPKTKGERGTFDAFILAHPALKPYASDIWNATTGAGGYGGITATQLAAVLWAESKGDPNAQSGKGALGIAQIYDQRASATNAAGVPFFRANLAISAADKQNTKFAIKYAAWRLSGYAAAHGGSIDDIWIHGYNPNFKPGVDGPANFISQYLPKNYVGVASPTIDQTVGKSVDTSTVKKTFTDKWAILDGKGTVKYITMVDPTRPPKNVLKYGGAPLTQSSFNQVWTQTYQDTFAAYTGRQASGREVASILAKAPSVYALSNTLANGKDFGKSPVYKQHAPGLVALARQTMGNSWKPSGGIIRKAIAQNWDQATFEANLRKRPEYLKGPEFMDSKAKMQSAYEQIYGKADPGAHKLIDEVTLQGWTGDEFQNWLRSQAAYKQTPEYQSKTLSFLGQLGLITGQVPTVGSAPAATSGKVGPNSPRIPGQGALTGNGLEVQKYAPS